MRESKEMDDGYLRESKRALSWAFRFKDSPLFTLSYINSSAIHKERGQYFPALKIFQGIERDQTSVFSASTSLRTAEQKALSL